MITTTKDKIEKKVFIIQLFFFSLSLSMHIFHCYFFFSFLAHCQLSYLFFSPSYHHCLWKWCCTTIIIIAITTINVVIICWSISFFIVVIVANTTSNIIIIVAVVVMSKNKFCVPKMEPQLLLFLYHHIQVINNNKIDSQSK